MRIASSHLAFIAALCLAASAAIQVQAADMTREQLLTAEQLKELNEPALDSYAKALELMNKTLLPESMEALRDAADADPRHIPLQFLCARSAISMARTGRGISLADGLERNEFRYDVDLANEYYNIASQCTQRILDTLNLPQELFDRAKRLKTIIDQEQSMIEVREQRREFASYQFLKEHVTEIYTEQKPQAAQTAEDLLKQIEAKKKKEAEKAKLPGTSGGMEFAPTRGPR